MTKATTTISYKNSMWAATDCANEKYFMLNTFMYTKTVCTMC